MLELANFSFYPAEKKGKELVVPPYPFAEKRVTPPPTLYPPPKLAVPPLSHYGDRSRARG
jgi:hypothetical protein